MPKFDPSYGTLWLWDQLYTISPFLVFVFYIVLHDSLIHNVEISMKEFLIFYTPTHTYIHHFMCYVVTNVTLLCSNKCSDKLKRYYVSSLRQRYIPIIKRLLWKRLNFCVEQPYLGSLHFRIQHHAAAQK